MHDGIFRTFAVRERELEIDAFELPVEQPGRTGKSWRIAEIRARIFDMRFVPPY
jgi:hypothetical protein